MAVSPDCWAEGGYPGTGVDTDRVTSAHPCLRACSRALLVLSQPLSGHPPHDTQAENVPAPL